METRHLLAATVIASLGLAGGLLSALPVQGGDKTAVTSPTRPRNNDENRIGYAGAALVVQEGTTSIGTSKWSTTQGLRAVHVVYKESPNGFDMRWKDVRVTRRDGTSTAARSIETGDGRNFLSIMQGEKPHELLWVPLEAIATLSLEKVAPQAYPDVTTEREIYDRWKIADSEGAKIENLTLRVSVSLQYPMPSGSKSLTGMLTNDLMGDLRLYDGSKWSEIPWPSVTKITVVLPNDAPAASAKPPRFLYRVQSPKYEGVWLEYSIPEDKAKK